ncbi:hypothetical protein Goari_017505 [Gossypium aridum]|uniref:Uncharacterized protein n=1 Tax=Gossypium aridum TaxID=34290 RepID=A0A7J8WLR2_GOSAI|nr:hypothetical protein [Gossypium aridum]
MLIPQISSLLLLREKKFTTCGPSTSTGTAPSGFHSLRKIPQCCLL